MSLQRFIRRIKLLSPGLFIAMVLYPLRKAYHAARSAQPRRRGLALWLSAWRELWRKQHAQPPPDAYDLPGSVQSYSITGQTIAITCTKKLSQNSRSVV